MITVRDIQEGLRQKQFLLHYQPKVSLLTGRIAGAEALIRWAQPDGSMRAASDFMPLAERSSLIRRITDQVFLTLIADMRTMRDVEPIPISFNVSARDFEDSFFSRRILDAIERGDMAPQEIEVEITETEALSGGAHLRSNLCLLAKAGVGLTMDDFGIGYSSIDTLSKWPFDAIKLDQGIISRMLDSTKNAKIVQSSIRLGHELNVEVVAEGVETEEQYLFLLEAGCKMVQGYLISRPISRERFIDLRRDTSQWCSFPVGLVHMAIIDHVQWRRQIASFVMKHANLPPDSPLRQELGFPDLSANTCSLGKWYLGDGRMFSEHEAFSALDIAHLELHRIGAALVNGIKGGEGMDVLTLQVKKLTECSTVVLGYLEALEDFGLAQMHRLH